jgi:hypothetical protein
MRVSLVLCVFTDRVADFSDDEEEFSSNDEGEGEGSDSEPTPEDALGRRARKAARSKIPTNARVRFFNSDQSVLVSCPFWSG